ncbi:HK97 family phage prohead protease [Aquisalinus luteolus]|uniref:Protease n=2 Tax=Aquisalinus luteolus TaxID=1566827 RepID=A0A8J3EVS2_9PROT|nr:HK97 family phage prohead protease [Aquisalinus luteolus]GGI01515.1 protease [Aquisalinus luteolus]
MRLMNDSAGLSREGGPVAVIEGYASIFGERDLNGDIVKRGAFAEKLIPGRLPAVKMLYQHAADQPIGRWLEMKETARGLYVRGEIILDSPRAREVATLVAGGALDGLSIGFRTRAARKIAGGRELTRLDLWEVSVVTFPMAPGARITRLIPADADTADTIREATRQFTL